jgi:hypothetical protein
MEATPLFFMACAMAFGAAAATATRWWYRRQLAALAARLAKTERARQYALQQGTQARRQVERLQRELSQLRRPVLASPRVLDTPPVAAEMATPNDVRDVPEAAQPPVPRPNGFADTLPMKA